VKWWRCLGHYGWQYAIVTRDDGKTDARFTCRQCGRRLGLLTVLHRRIRADHVYDEKGERVT